MNIVSLILSASWLIGGYFVWRFVVSTGGRLWERIGHYFGGSFVMLGLAGIMIWIYAIFSPTFAGRLNIYMMSHLYTGPARAVIKNQEYIVVPLTVNKSGSTNAIVELLPPSHMVRVIRRGRVNDRADIESGTLQLDPSQDIIISFWWLLWDTKYYNPGSAKN